MTNILKSCVSKLSSFRNLQKTKSPWQATIPGLASLARLLLNPKMKCLPLIYQDHQRNELKNLAKKKSSSPSLILKTQPTMSKMVIIQLKEAMILKLRSVKNSIKDHIRGLASEH